MTSYHQIVHDVAVVFGFQYDDSAPDWIHPFIHLILVLAPAMLSVVLIYF